MTISLLSDHFSDPITFSFMLKSRLAPLHRSAWRPHLQLQLATTDVAVERHPHAGNHFETPDGPASSMLA